jgi:hypothetical protein
MPRTLAIYPAIVACINETRLPERQEIELVAARVWNETRDAKTRRSSMLVPGSAEHRKVLRVAVVALGVRGETAITKMLERLNDREPNSRGSLKQRTDIVTTTGLIVAAVAALVVLGYIGWITRRAKTGSGAAAPRQRQG